MRKIWLVLAVVAILFASVSIFANVSAATKKPASKNNANKTVVVKKKAAPKKSSKTAKKVLGIFTAAFSGGLVNCHMPDGKTIKATKKDCDNVTSFWNKNKPSNPGNSGGGSSGGGSNGGGGNSGGGSSSPRPYEVTNAELLSCSSSSCAGIATVRVTGYFNNNSRIVLSDGINNYSEPQAAVVGGNFSDQIIMDFYNLPTCTSFDVYVIQPGSLSKSPVGIATPCI